MNSSADIVSPETVLVLFRSKKALWFNSNFYCSFKLTFQCLLDKAAGPHCLRHAMRCAFVHTLVCNTCVFTMESLQHATADIWFLKKLHQASNFVKQHICTLPPAVTWYDMISSFPCCDPVCQVNPNWCITAWSIVLLLIPEDKRGYGSGVAVSNVIELRLTWDVSAEHEFW